MNPRRFLGGVARGINAGISREIPEEISGRIPEGILNGVPEKSREQFQRNTGINSSKNRERNF